jgi:hypothetical protein
LYYVRLRNPYLPGYFSDNVIVAEPQLVIPTLGVDPADLPPIIKRLKKWREKNHLSQRQAAAVMERAGFPIRLSALQHWERGFRKPGTFSSHTLKLFLDQNPTVTNPPVFKPGPKK